MNLFLDLETIPAAVETEDLVREQFERRSSYSSTRTARPTTFEDYLHGTSLDPNFGQILCIGYAIDDEAAGIIHGDPTSPKGFEGASEKGMLEEFWKIATSAKQLIGHNLVAFDIPFLWKRSVLNGVKPTLNLADSSLAFDTMLEWDLAMPRKHTGLDLLSKLLGVPSSKTEMHGAEVFDYYRAGKLEQIYEYCKRDVEATRSVYKKITFEA